MQSSQHPESSQEKLVPTGFLASLKQARHIERLALRLAKVKSQYEQLIQAQDKLAEILLIDYEEVESFNQALAEGLNVEDSLEEVKVKLIARMKQFDLILSALQEGLSKIFQEEQSFDILSFKKKYYAILSRVNHFSLKQGECEIFDAYRQIFLEKKELNEVVKFFLNDTVVSIINKAEELVKQSPQSLSAADDEEKIDDSSQQYSALMNLPPEMMMLTLGNIDYMKIGACLLVCKEWYLNAKIFTENCSRDRLTHYFPRAYVELLKKVAVDWDAELDLLSKNSFEKYTPKQYKTIVDLIEYGLSDQHSSKDILQENEHGYSVLDWLAIHGHQQLLDIIFARRIEPIYQMSDEKRYQFFSSLNSQYWIRRQNEYQSGSSHLFGFNREFPMPSIIFFALKCNQLAYIQKQCMAEQKDSFIKELNNELILMNEVVRLKHYEMLRLLLDFVQREYLSPLDLDFWYHRYQYNQIGILNQAVANGDHAPSLMLLEFFLKHDQGEFISRFKDCMSRSKSYINFLHIAVAKGNVTLVQAMINLLYEYLKDADEAIEFLLSCDMPTPLMLAAYYNDQKILDYFFELCPDVCSKAIAYMVPTETCTRHVGIESKHDFLLPDHFPNRSENIDCRSIIKFFLKRGCDINAVDQLGNTALQTAVSRRNSDLVAILIKKGANVRVMDKFGRSLLHLALIDASQNINEMLTIFVLLIAAGVELNAADHQGKTVLAKLIAMQKPYLKREESAMLANIINLLEQHGATIQPQLSSTAQVQQESRLASSATLFALPRNEGEKEEYLEQEKHSKNDRY